MVWWLVIILFAAGLAPGIGRACGSRGGWVLALGPAWVFVSLLTQWSPVVAGQVVSVSFAWAPALNLSLSLRLDGLSLLFGLLVTGIGALILVYAGAYLKGDGRLSRLWILLLLFMAAMLGLVLADNLLTLFIFWELTSITSYLLIGFNSDQAESRASALQALLVTGGGGLMLLPGLLILGSVGGSYEISRLAENAAAITGHAWYVPLLVLILAGAFTKSAQFPFHFWLPGAMAAPTPISAYLHSATMVKAGVYLLARLHPVLGGTAEWFWLVAPVGAVTMAVGAGLALRATDLKQILAYATVSVLGTLTMLLGIGTEATLTAALAVLLAHALYKGALFLVAGAIDHSVHQRDIRELGGLRSAMPATFAAAVLAGVSMAGVLPTFGFLAKEVWYESLGNAAGVPFLAVSVLSNIGLVVAVGLVCVRPYFGRSTYVTQGAVEGSFATWSPPVVLGLTGLLTGLLPAGMSELLSAGSRSVAGQAVPVKLALWHGVNVTLLLSLLTLAGGMMLYVFRQRAVRLLSAIDGLSAFGPSAAYQRLLQAVLQLARVQTAILQNGYLRIYVLVMAGLIVLSVWMALGEALRSHLEPLPLDLRAHEVLLAVLILSAAVVAVCAQTWLLAVGALGIVGYTVAGVFVLFGAPDLAMTQFVIETLTVILFVMAFSRLPDFRQLTARRTRVRDAFIAVGAGGTITVLLLFAMTVRSDHPISDYFAARSVTEAHGRNIVNVILVDFRALDTLGEITVLAIAAMGVYSLLMLRPDSDPEHLAERRVAAEDATSREAGLSELATGAGPPPDQEGD